MEFESWQVDLAEAVVKHPSGFRIAFEGNPADPTDISPGNFPPGLSAADQARLLRCGMVALARAAKVDRRSSRSGAAAGIRSYGKPATPAKSHFKNKSSRPVLSLKR